MATPYVGASIFSNGISISNQQIGYGDRYGRIAGNSNLQWDPVAQFLTMGDGVAVQQVRAIFNRPAGQLAGAQLNTDGIVRWSWGTSGIAEAGANSGTEFSLNCYSDAGIYIDTPIQIRRDQYMYVSRLSMFASNIWQTGSTVFDKLGSDTGTFTQVLLNSAVNTAREFTFTTASITRWNVFMDTDTETVGGGGGSFGINAYNNAGTFAGTILYAGRQQGATIYLAGPGTASLRSVVINQSSQQLSTVATDGFLFIPYCPGQPTGTPTAYVYTAPICWDDTNHKLWIYSPGAGAWKGVALT